MQERNKALINDLKYFKGENEKLQLQIADL
jgi:hypothetical protein